MSPAGSRDRIVLNYQGEVVSSTQDEVISSAPASSSEGLLDEAFNNAAFVKFLTEFPDRGTLDPSNRNSAELLSRYEAFKNLAEAGRALKRVLSERILIDLGIMPNEEELAGIDVYLKSEVIEKRNFGLLKNILEQVRQYNELPDQIRNKEKEILALGDRNELAVSRNQLSGQVSQAETKVAEAKESKQAIGLVKEGAEVAKDLRQGLEPLEEIFLSRAEAVASSVEGSLKQLEGLQTQILEANKKSPQPGNGEIPALGILRADLKRAKGQGKKDPKDYLAALARADFSGRLESVKYRQIDFCAMRVRQLEGLAVQEDAGENFPRLQYSLEEFGNLQRQAGLVDVDANSSNELAGLQIDFKVVLQIRRELENLQRDPGYRAGCVNIDQITGNLETEAGRDLVQGLGRGLIELREIQERLGQSPLGVYEIRKAAEYSAQGFTKKLLTFYKDPEKQVGKKLEQAEDEALRLQEEHREIASRIQTID